MKKIYLVINMVFVHFFCFANDHVNEYMKNNHLTYPVNIGFSIVESCLITDKSRDTSDGFALDSDQKQYLNNFVYMYFIDNTFANNMPIAKETIIYGYNIEKMNLFELYKKYYIGIYIIVYSL